MRRMTGSGASLEIVRAPQGAADSPCMAGPALPQASAEEEPFAALWARLYERLVAYVTVELGDRDDAEDVVQASFASVWAQYFRKGAPPPDTEHDALLYRSVQNRLLNHRRDRVRLAMKLETYLSLWYGRAKRWMIPTEFVEHHELVRVVDGAIRSMSAREREVFLMRREAKMSYEEIAQATGVSPVTVNSLMHKAQVVLREHVEAAGYGGARRKAGRGGAKGRIR